KSNSFCTLLTHTKGYTSYKGNFKIFCIQFKSNGLFAIFGIPQKELINSILRLEDILGNDNNLLTEQLEGSADIIEMAKLMNSFLTSRLLCKKLKDRTYII